MLEAWWGWWWWLWLDARIRLHKKATSWMSLMFCNILVTWSPFWQVRMLLPRPWIGRTTPKCKILSESYTLSANRCICVIHLAWCSRFLQSKRHFLNHLVTELWSTAPLHFTNVFCYFHSILIPVQTRVEYSRIKYKLHGHLCTFQTVHRVMPATTSLRANNKGYLFFRLELLESRDISAAN